MTWVLNMCHKVSMISITHHTITLCNFQPTNRKRCPFQIRSYVCHIHQTLWRKQMGWVPQDGSHLKLSWSGLCIKGTSGIQIWGTTTSALWNLRCGFSKSEPGRARLSRGSVLQLGTDYREWQGKSRWLINMFSFHLNIACALNYSSCDYMSSVILLVFLAFHFKLPPLQYKTIN